MYFHYQEHKVSELMELFKRLSSNKSNTVCSTDIKMLQRIVILEDKVEKLNEHLRHIYDQDRQLRLALKNNKILNYKDAKV